MTLLRKTAKAKLLVFSTLLIIACAALAPKWIVDLDEPLKKQSLMYASGDEQNFYRFSIPKADTNATLERFNLEGQLEQRITLTDAGSYNKYNDIWPLVDNSAFVVNRNLNELFYIDPNSETFWQGANQDILDSNQTVTIFQSYLNAEEELVFVGELITAIDPHNKQVTPMTGRVGSNGYLLAFTTYENVKQYGLKLHKLKDSTDFILSGRYNEEFTNDTELRSFIAITDHELSHKLKNDFEELYKINLVSNDKFEGSIDVKGNESHGTFYLDGTPITTDRFRNSDLIGSPYWGESVLYIVGQDWVGEWDTHLEICQFNFNFEKNWCKKTHSATSHTRANIQIVNQNQLGISVNSETEWQIIGVHAGLTLEQLNGLTGEAKGSLIAKYQLQSHHMLFNENGSLSLDIKEEPFYYKGHLIMLSLFNIFVKPEEIYPGVAHLNSSLFLSDQRIISDSVYSDNESLYNSEPRLTMWEK